jgi:predicted anti-sigma-YlaC factor YlaD
MISCREVLEALSDHLDDGAAATLRRELEAHIDECRTCRVIYDTARRTLRIVTEAGTFEIPESLSERLLGRTMAAVDASRKRRGRPAS